MAKFNHVWIMFFIFVMITMPIYAQPEPFEYQQDFLSMDYDFILMTDESLKSTLIVNTVARERIMSTNFSSVFTHQVDPSNIIDPNSIKITDLRNPDLEITRLGSNSPWFCENKYYYDVVSKQR